MKASIWDLAPAPGIPEPPALISDSSNLWLAYFRSDDEGVAVVHFSGVIEHHLSPVNDEGLGQHPYAQAGLQFYSFHELTGTKETLRWSPLGMRHWVVTFKDNTLDVLAKSANVIVPSMTAATPLDALYSVRK